VQTGGETLQEFAAAVEPLAHRALVGLPADHIQTEAIHAFIDGIRDREVKQHLLLGSACMLNEARIPQCKHAELGEEYAKKIGLLIEEFDRRLTLSKEEDIQLKLTEDPFSVDTEEVPLHL
jgi:hypothetical protein